MKKLIGTVVLFCLCACIDVEPPGRDSTPPTVVEFQPQGDRIPVDTDVTVLFSEPVAMGQGESDLVVLVPSGILDGEWLADLDKPPLSSKRAQTAISCDARTELDGRRIILQPWMELEPARDYTVAVSAAVQDLYGNSLVDELGWNERGQPVGTNTHVLHAFTTGTAGVRITEILANPEGVESEGEYIEILNMGGSTVDMTNWRLGDTGGTETGDRLGPCAPKGPVELGAGGVALLVGQAFLPSGELAAGTLLVCTDHASLTPRGLRNTGDEILVLSDPEGSEMDRYGGWIDMSKREGCGVMRIDPNAPDSEENWMIPDGEPCRSPGQVTLDFDP